MTSSQNLKPNQASNPYLLPSFHGGIAPYSPASSENRSLTPLSLREVQRKGQKWLRIAASFDLFKDLNTGINFIRPISRTP